MGEWLPLGQVAAPLPTSHGEADAVAGADARRQQFLHSSLVTALVEELFEGDTSPSDQDAAVDGGLSVWNHHLGEYGLERLLLRPHERRPGRGHDGHAFGALGAPSARDGLGGWWQCDGSQARPAKNATGKRGFDPSPETPGASTLGRTTVEPRHAA